ncbi:MAG: hypothetical protein JNM59_07355 [Hyphomonadaceae bacterium]|nr:hypothetical protein [Hyphomonadaceae bacterium]
MRALPALLLLASCASVGASATPPERVTGCWINRDAGVVTMRWLPDRARAGMLKGVRATYGQAGAQDVQNYSLQTSEVGWSMCQLDEGDVATACWQVAEGDGGSLEGGRVFLDVYGERLRIAIVGDGPERVVFHGVRDGCD